MRRITLLVSVVVLMTTMLVASTAPALAATRTFQCQDFNPALTGVITFNTETGQIHFNCKRH